MEGICQRLTSQSNEDIDEALADLSKRTRALENVSELFDLNGFSGLFKVLKNQDTRFMSAVIGVFANCTNSSQKWRAKFYEEGGIAVIVEVLAKTQDPDIICRCARLFGNLSKYPISHNVLQDNFIITSFVNYASIQDVKCQASCLRMLRKICTNKKSAKMAVENEKFFHLLHLMNSPEQDVVMLCLRMVRDLLKTQLVEICYSIIECDMLSVIFRFCTHEVSDIQNIAFEILFMITLNSGCRVTVSMEGGLELFVDRIKTLDQSESFRYATQSLCLCAREAVSRNRIKTVGALPALVKILSEESFVCFHEAIVAAFVAFIFDDLSLGLLIKAGVIPAIMKYLDGLTNIDFCKNQERIKNEPIEAEKPTQSQAVGAEEISQPSEEVPPPPVTINEDMIPNEQCQQQWFQSSPETSPYPHASPYSIPSSPQRLPSYSPPHHSYLDSPRAPPSYSPPHSPYTNSPKHKASSHFYACSPPHSPYSNPSMSPPRTYCYSPPHSPYSGKSPQASSPSYSPHVSPPYSPSYSSTSSTFQDDVYSDPLNASAGSSKPLPYHFQSADGIYAMIHGMRGPIHDILLLLSRFSQANDPSTFFLFLPGFNQLLNYLLLSYNPNPKCARILNRLTLNSHCFEIMLKEKLMPRLYLRLSTGWSLEHLVKMFDDAREIQKEEEKEAIDEDTKIDCFMEDNLYKWKEPSQATLNLCRLLVSNLRSQSDSSYGKGVLSHILLTGSKKLKEKVVVSLPHIIRSGRLKQRIFCELKAANLLVQMLSTFPDIDSEMFVLNVEAICALFHLLGMSCEKVSGIKGTAQLDDGIHEDPEANVSQAGKEIKAYGAEVNEKETDINEPALKKRKLSDSKAVTQPVAKKSKSPVSVLDICSDSEQRNVIACDANAEKDDKEEKLTDFKNSLTNCKTVFLKLPSKKIIPCASNFLGKHSQVFERMLSQTYIDSQKSFISIPDINERAFLKLIHFLCGCECRLDMYADCQGICYYNFMYKSFNDDKDILSLNPDEGSSCQDTNQLHNDTGISSASGDNENISTSCEDSSIFATHLLSCAERFFVDALKTKCEEYLMNITSEENVVDLFLFSTLHNSSVLKRYTFMYIVTFIPCPKVRAQCFTEILCSNERETFLKYLKSELDHYLVRQEM